jgi:hypothetical protein
MPVDYGRFRVEFEVEWNINIREVLPDNPIDIIKDFDYRLANRLVAMSKVEADYDRLPEEPIVIIIKGWAEIDVPLPEDTEGMSDKDIESELKSNARYELVRDLKIDQVDVDVLSIVQA